MSFAIAVLICIVFISQTICQDVVINRCPLSEVADEVIIPRSMRAKTSSPSNGKRFVFKAETKRLSCQATDISVQIDTYDSFLTFLTTGELQIHQDYFPIDEYCISKIDKKHLNLQHCKVECGKTHICVPKCCHLDQIEEKGRCVAVSIKERWTPWIYSKDEYDHENASAIPSSSHLPVHFKYNPSPHPEFDFIRTHDLFTIRVLDNGIVVVNETEEGWLPETMPEYFCLDGIKHNGNGTYRREENDQIIYVFADHEDDGRSKTTIKLVAFMFAILFLILTVIIYLLIWDKHNIHGWTVFSFVNAFLIFLIALTIAHFIAIYHDESVLRTGNCVALGIVIHFAFLCILCWMSVINFDFWATFRNLSPSKGSNKSLKRYMLYFLFAVGVPLVIITASIIIHYSTSEETEFSPGYGLENCRLHSASQLYYLYIPMAISLVFNIIMFSWTVITLYMYKKKTQNATSNSHNQWILFCKLFLIMGITWIMEFISGIFETENWFWEYLFLIFDIVNTTFQAAAVFFIFAAKRENLLWIFRRYPKTKPIIGPILRFPLCRVDDADVEQTEMTSADKNRIDRNTMVTFNRPRRGSSTSNNSFE